MQVSSKRIAVVGSGLQGACVALELAARGVRVDLYERNSVCFGESSATNEGKIHLGFVYAHDESFATSALMMEGALCFEPLLRRWLGAAVDRIPVSTPFTYLVHSRSMISADAFAAHAGKVASTLAARTKGKRVAYFGQDPAETPIAVGDPDGVFNPAAVRMLMRTPEIGIESEALAAVFRERLASEPAIRCLTGRTVQSVRDDGTTVRVTSARGGAIDTEGYDAVVNAAWSGRLPIDADAGLPPDRPWMFRLKYFVKASIAQNVLPSVTIVLGPFGDIVSYDSDQAFLSWYPVGTVRSEAMTPPGLPLVLAGDAASSMRRAILGALTEIVPSVAEAPLADVEVKGGWIFAWGATDIDDPSSILHQRSAIGCWRKGRYLTIDTGKLTTAPYFAMMAADQITSD
ncbi:MAG: FAD-dependent oxidoreductase [Bauldia sp.]|nr:MAG: FAD-dependent oxidoreductase [Bauldia sp.]